MWKAHHHYYEKREKEEFSLINCLSEDFANKTKRNETKCTYFWLISKKRENHYPELKLITLLLNIIKTKHVGDSYVYLNSDGRFAVYRS